MIKLIIFDVGGVIDTFDEKQYMPYISKKLGMDPIKFRKALIPLLNQMEVGKLKQAKMEKILFKKFKVSKNKLEWDSAFLKLNSVNRDVVNLINKLSKNYTIIILTNVSISRHLIKMKHYLKYVKYKRIFASCYIKMHKPEFKIYRFVLKKMKAKPEEAIFVDNLMENVEAARKVGIKSIQFINYKDLVKNLEKQKIKI